MIISFSGNDGSGKTTIGKTLIENLKKRGIFITYRHEYDYVFIKYLFKIIGENRVNAERKKYVPAHSENIESVRLKKLSLVQKIWPYVVWLDNVLTILYYKIFYTNKVILLDRYPYDMYLSFEYMGRGSKLLKWLFLLIPKADVQIIFYATPEVAMKRKTDHTYPLQFYITQLERYKTLAKKKNIELHNTEEQIEKTIDFVIERIISKAPKWLLYELRRNQ